MDLKNFLKNDFPKQNIKLKDSTEVFISDLYDILQSTYQHVLQPVQNKSTIEESDWNSFIEKVNKQSEFAKAFKLEIIDKVETLFEDIIEPDPSEDCEDDDIIEELTKDSQPSYVVDSETPYNFNVLENITWKRPGSFKFLKEKNDTNTWKKMLVEFSKELYEKDPSRFQQLINNDSMNFGRKRSRGLKYLSNTEEGVIKPERIADNIFIETGLSAMYIRKMILFMLNHYNYNINDFKIYLRADYT